MLVLNQDDKISLYGTLNIKNYKEGITTNIKINAENKKVGIIGEYLYNLLLKKYTIFDYKWEDVKKELKTTNVIVNNKLINPNCKFKFYGYVEDRTGIPSEYGKRYECYTNELFFDELIESIESMFEEYIVDFNTDESGLKFVITKIEIIE